MGLNRTLATAATVLALLGIVWTAAIQWQALQDRVTAIERENLYMRGTITLPQKASQ